jgi:hypothetical protein
MQEQGPGVLSPLPKGAELGGPFHCTRQSAFKQSNSFLLLRALRGTFLQETSLASEDVERAPEFLFTTTQTRS